MTKEAQYVQFVNRQLTRAARINGGLGMFVIIKYKLSAHCIHIRILYGQIFCHFETEIFLENNKLFAQTSPPPENEIDFKKAHSIAGKVLLLRFREAKKVC